MFNDASKVLFKSSKHRVFFRSITILVPKVGSTVRGRKQTVDMLILRRLFVIENRRVRYDASQIYSEQQDTVAT